MARLYANENFREVIEALRALGDDVLTTLEAGKASQRIADAEVLAFATENNRAVLTLNRRDFIRLHTRQGDYAGIIVCTQEEDTDRQATRIHDAIFGQESLKGKLIRVNRPQRQV
jgi:predicted nuclease of predicted toxin-antitoxin system